MSIGQDRRPVGRRQAVPRPEAALWGARDLAEASVLQTDPECRTLCGDGQRMPACVPRLIEQAGRAPDDGRLPAVPRIDEGKPALLDQHGAVCPRRKLSVLEVEERPDAGDSRTERQPGRGPGETEGLVRDEDLARVTQDDVAGSCHRQIFDDTTLRQPLLRSEIDEALPVVDEQAVLGACQDVTGTILVQAAQS